MDVYSQLIYDNIFDISKDVSHINEWTEELNTSLNSCTDHISTIERQVNDISTKIDTLNSNLDLINRNMTTVFFILMIMIPIIIFILIMIYCKMDKIEQYLKYIANNLDTESEDEEDKENNNE